MTDWTINYILHILEAKDWSANKLATEAGVAASTINRPLRERDNLQNKLSRQTLLKIQTASGIDPAPFISNEFKEEAAIFSQKQPTTTARRSLEGLIERETNDKPSSKNEIKISIAGPIAQIAATIDRDGIKKLRDKLDAIESMLDD